MSSTEPVVRRSLSAPWLIAAFSFAASADNSTRGVRRHGRGPSWLLILALSSAASCGKVGAPVPPARFTERTSQLTAKQRGAAVVLAWPAPPLSQNESSRSYVARAEIYRLAERVDDEPLLDPDDYQEAARVVGFLDRQTIEAQVNRLGRLQFSDTIDLSQATAQSTRLRYAIRYVNGREQTAAFSNTVAVEPAARVALPPRGLQAAALAQDVVRLTWTNPDANVDGTQPASLAGYNLYRRRPNREAAGEPLNDDPITEAAFNDTTFTYMLDYVYFVRALSQGAAGLIESADSEPLAYTPIDTFAPASPNPVSVASANGTISLFWPSSPERDVIGYNIYRARSADAPDAEWVKLNDQPMTTVTFRDDRVVIDEIYFYRVTAIDRFINESAPSKVVSETAHP